MRKLAFVILTTFLFYKTSFTQTLSFAEMQKSLDYNISDFEDYVTLKGFKFLNIYKDVDTCTVYSFSYSRNINNDHAVSFIDLIVCSEKNRIHQQFSDEKKYIEFKKVAKSLGYKYYNSRNENDIIVSEFYNSKYSLLFGSQKANTGITIYGITLSYLSK